METNYTEAERYYQAQKRVKEIKDFYAHLTVYLLCNPIVIAVNLMTSPGYLYFWFSLLGWGVAIVLHGLKAFDCFPFLNKEWEQRKIEEILEKDNNKQLWK
ncbi:2TM domain-containing protein [Flavobacterium aquidurense]|uniref:Histidine kinase n=1 Tax=Flavobacterium frigidimaris TaxID=262320 RepID=A0ABX4BP06_FLAFR|nr:2TM domain-containing protein [Flavobacterium frigidimaris]OXA77719.1 histidine kinase [Flavobacterium frigidimaris]SDY86831.1 2TM domain-containing protein [Flavobacterium aquidurense]